MSDAAAHAAWLYRDCTRDGWGVFRIAEAYTLEKGRKTWTEPELIQAIAAWMEHEAANNTQQRPETVQHTANRSSTRPRNKQKRSAVSAGSNLQLHRRAGPDVRQPGQVSKRPGHQSTGSQPASPEATAARLPGTRTQTIQRPEDNHVQGKVRRAAHG